MFSCIFVLICTVCGKVCVRAHSPVQDYTLNSLSYLRFCFQAAAAHYWWSESRTCRFHGSTWLRYKHAYVHVNPAFYIYISIFFFPSDSACFRHILLLYVSIFFSKRRKHRQFGWKSCSPVSSLAVNACVSSFIFFLCYIILFFFFFFFCHLPGSGRRESSSLVMSVFYLVAHLLKDLTLELSTQPDLRKSLTHHINFSLWLQTALSFSFQSYLDPSACEGLCFLSTSCQG